MSEEITSELFDVEAYDRKNAMPWDLLFPGTHYVSDEVYEHRYSICQSCEFFTKIPPRVCKKCHCWMKIKCAIGHAYCPEGKWGPEDIDDFVTKKDFSTEEEFKLFEEGSRISQAATVKQEKDSGITLEPN